MKKWYYLLLLLVLLEALSTVLYLGKTEGVGFPIEDAWIHQTYARNFGLHGVMAFSPGQISTGNTSFAWTVLLAAGYFLKIPFFFWTYFLGAIFAIATAFVAAQLSQNYFGDFRNAVIVAVICILEWHLAWAALSGMEISLFTFLTLLFFLLLNRGISPFLLGGLTGIIVLVRPEGILLALVYGFKLLFGQPRDTKRILLDSTVFLIMFSIVITPWIVFNLIYGHHPFPNTISAKFMTYSYPWSLWKSLKYLWNVLIYFLNGPLMLFIPGAGFVIYNAVRTRDMHLFYPSAWFLTLIGLYAIALPAIYNHGRYLMPLIPLIVIYGFEGLNQLLNRFAHIHLSRIVAWFSLVSLIFLWWIHGASDYAYQIQLFDLVHIKAAQWINTNTPPNTVLATHDIGIIGYYTQRQIVDLAGLVTPEIIPLMNDPHKMADYVRAKHVTYLIVYSGYYRELIKLLNAHRVFSPGADKMRAIGAEPFEIYEINR